ncbi:MAG: anhydro-N-acetylmuramic acid kinase [Treponema sp.]|nr:anhydro-N-acetylmuramic acid kinase [Treponema sp.]
MLQQIEKLLKKKKKLAIGLMSGTSLDGMDAALLEIEGSSFDTKVNFMEFLTLPYDNELRSILMNTVMGDDGGSRLICALNFLIGDIASSACIELCKKAGIQAQEIDFIGSHGQTIYHLNESIPLAGRMIRGTLQIGEAAIIAERLGTVTVSDFRVRDMAAGGQGAPLVPYTEYLLYRKEKKTIALQNIGGIGNITLLPASCKAEDVLAFDTGPGNMIIDAGAHYLLGKSMDDEGRHAAKGKVHQGLLDFMFAFDEDYLEQLPPKSTGRERYNDSYMKKMLEKAKEEGLSPEDILATFTRYTAETIHLGIKQFCTPLPEELYVSGGGLQNKTLMKDIKELLGSCNVRSGDDLGIPAEAKEAVAFAILANEAIHGLHNNSPSATGASKPVIMGKISF